MIGRTFVEVFGEETHEFVGITDSLQYALTRAVPWRPTTIQDRNGARYVLLRMDDAYRITISRDV